MNDTLLSRKQLAAQLGRSPAYVTAMQLAGYKLPYAGRTTRKHALAWLAAHADFRPTAYLQARTRELRGGRARRAVSVAGK